MIELALAEDIGRGDATTEAIVPAEARARATIVAKEPGVICGLDAAAAVFRRLDPTTVFEPVMADGAPIADPPQPIARVEATVRAILTGERTALNLIQRMSGIATATRAYVERVDGTGAEVLDTRKTAPGLRMLDKHAVACGGGVNHRRGLDDAILIKDNHVAVAGGVAAAVRLARAASRLPIEIEVDTLEQLDEALVAQPEAILLDNMDPQTLREAVRRTGGRCRLEASGGVTLETIRAVAETGVDAISVGALTHSVAALDVSLEVDPWQP